MAILAGRAVTGSIVVTTPESQRVRAQGEDWVNKPVGLKYQSFSFFISQGNQQRVALQNRFVISQKSLLLL